MNTRPHREPPGGLDRLAVHTITTRPWSGSECIRRYADAGVRGITFWRHNFESESPTELGRLARDHGLAIAGLARGGFFPAGTDGARRKAVDENLAAIDEAAACGAPVLVLVCGAVPGQPLDESRAQIRDGIAACLDHARAAGVVLAVEPLHPMYADDRSAINTMRQANDLCESLGSPPHLGIACDVYHTWWDPDLDAEIRRAGDRRNLAAFHLCDWMTPTADLLNDRGIMGEGCIDNRRIARRVDDTGFAGFREVEVFSLRHWARDQADVLRDVIAAYRRLFPEPA